MRRRSPASEASSTGMVWLIAVLLEPGIFSGRDFVRDIQGWISAVVRVGIEELFEKTGVIHTDGATGAGNSLPPKLKSRNGLRIFRGG